jgi:hypothetical protein
VVKGLKALDQARGEGPPLAAKEQNGTNKGLVNNSLEANAKLIRRRGPHVLQCVEGGGGFADPGRDLSVKCAVRGDNCAEIFELAHQLDYAAT